jgi:hypothetical protein
MSDLRKKICSIYEDLSDAKGLAGQRVRRRIDYDGAIPVYAGVMFPDNHLLLEVGPVSKAIVPGGVEGIDVKGVGINLQVAPESADKLSLILELQQHASSDVFVTFVCKACEELENINNESQSVRATIALIKRWRDFFSGVSGILSENAQTGLYGELFLMKKLSESDLPIRTLVRCWTGSSRTNQDYEFGEYALEIKASSAIDTSRIKVTNTRQLDNTGLKALYLVRISFDVRQGSARTLPDLVHELRNLIAHRAPDMTLTFEEKLLRSDYRDEQSSKYALRAYSLREILFYKVVDGFPRLVEQNMPRGVLQASYTISVEKCDDFLTDSFSVCEELRNYSD